MGSAGVGARHVVITANNFDQSVHYTHNAATGRAGTGVWREGKAVAARGDSTTENINYGKAH